MAWVKIDDNIFNHPKMVAAGHLGQHLQIRALAYCNQYLTDGFICADALHMSIGLHTVDLGDGKPRKVDMMAVVARLVKVGVWDRVEGGYMIHDYFDYQPSRASLKEKQERISEARRAAGLKSGQVRRAKGGVNKGTNDEQLVQEVVQRGRQDPSANAAPRGDQGAGRDLPQALVLLRRLETPAGLQRDARDQHRCGRDGRGGMMPQSPANSALGFSPTDTTAPWARRRRTTEIAGHQPRDPESAG